MDAPSPGPVPALPRRQEGDLVPDVRWRVRRGNDWDEITTATLFDGQNVIVFALPGAFTPTCSSTHLPGYNELAPLFRAQGIDRIVCVAVNDPYVMAEWGRDQEAGNVLLLPDGNAEFTRQMGMLADKSDDALGQRSWRYSMLVRDRRIEKMFVEPDRPGDPFEVSDAETMLHYLDPDARGPDRVAVLTRAGCPYCARAKQMLGDAGYDYAELALPHSLRSRALGAIAAAGTVPQVFINGERVGGLEELEDFLRRRDAGSAGGDKPAAAA